MRVAFLLTWVLIFSQPCFSQHNLIDSLHIALKKEKTDTGKAIVLFNLSYAYQIYKPDSGLLLAQEAYDLSSKHHFLKGESWALNQIGGAFSRMGNNTKALEYYIRQLKIEEERGYPDDMAIINMNIALVYNSEKDKAKAIYYILKADSIITKNNLKDLELYSLLNTGEIYEKANLLSEALSYTQRCYSMAIKNNDSLMVGSALNNLGNIYTKSGELEKAVSSYRSSVPYLTAMNDNQSISEGKLGLAKAFDNNNQPDSALQYAREAYTISAKDGFLKNALGASMLLSKLYKSSNNIDSAFAFNETMLLLKDSIEGIEKIKQLESMSIEEQLRQKHLADVAEQEHEEQRQRLQLLAIGIVIPIFFLLSMYISRKKVHRKLIQFSGVLSLLMLFEYITLLIHPVVAEVTHHTPWLEIIIFVGIAALAVPAHHKIESWFIKRLAWIHERHTHKQAATANEESPSTATSDVQEEIAPAIDGENENASPENNPGEAIVSENKED